MELNCWQGFHSRRGVSRMPGLVLMAVALSLTVACQGILPYTHNSSAILEKSQEMNFDGQIKTLAYGDGGQSLIVGGCQFLVPEERKSCLGGLINIWDLKGSSTKSSWVFPRTVSALAVSPNGKAWVAGDSEGRLILSDTAGQPPKAFHQKREITALAFSPDGKWVASGSTDPFFPLGFMDTASRGVIKVKTKFDPVSALAFSPDGKDVAVGMANGNAVTWEFRTNETPIPITTGNARRDTITSLAFSPDGRELALGKTDGRVLVWDRRSSRVVLEYKTGASVNSLAFSPDERLLAIGQDNGKLVLIEVETGKEVWSTRYFLPVGDLAYAPDGSSLAVAVQQRIYVYRPAGQIPSPASQQRAAIPSHSGPTGLAAVSSRKLAAALRISQEQFLWLLPFDRLIESSVDAMVKAVPGAVIEREGARPGQVVLTVGHQSVQLDFGRLKEATGKAGLDAAVKSFEAAQKLLLVKWNGPSNALEDLAVTAMVAEIGPGVTLVARRDREAKDRWTDRTSGGTVAALNDSMLPQGVKYLKLTTLNRPAGQELRRWTTGDGKSQSPSIAYVLDLRNAVGMDLDSAISIADDLVPPSRVVAEVILRKTGERIDYRSKGPGIGPGGLVVLVNEHTTGTAEMLACAIREAGVGVLVGNNTGGMDDVFTTFPLPGGAALRVSTARFYCPNQRSIRWKGQQVDIRMGPAARNEVGPIGTSRTDFSLRPPYRASHIAAIPAADDPQLNLAVNVAVCLSRENMLAKRSQADRPAFASLVGACR